MSELSYGKTAFSTFLRQYSAAIIQHAASSIFRFVSFYSIQSHQ